MKAPDKVKGGSSVHEQREVHCQISMIENCPSMHLVAADSDEDDGMDPLLLTALQLHSRSHYQKVVVGLFSMHEEGDITARKLSSAE